jgi:RecA-family ATPase
MTIESIGLDSEVWDAGDDDDKIPPRQWLVAETFCANFLSGLTGVGGAGKSAVRYVQYMAAATQRPLSGQFVHRRCRVLILCLEDDRDEARRRLLAARLHHEVSKDELKGWLFVWTPRNIKMIERNARGTVVLGAMEQRLRTLIKKHKIDLVGIDPFIKIHSVGENDNAAIDFVASRLAEIAQEMGCAVDYLHHHRKGTGTAGDADSGRGATSLRDAGRLVSTLTVMTQEEAASFGLSEKQRRLLVRLDGAKRNIVPPASEATWFELAGVELGNRTDEYPYGDEVQTVRRWYPPDIFTGLKVQEILDDIDKGPPEGGRYSNSSGAKQRAAWQVVTHHSPHMNEKQARSIINTWVKNEVLIPVKYCDEETRKERHGLRVNPVKRPS